MSAAFSQSMRSLAADRGRGGVVGIAFGGLFLLGWLLWFLEATVTVREASSGRVEVARAAHAVEAPVAGPVWMTSMFVGKVVQAGEVLMELGSDELRLALAEEEARRDLLAVQEGPLEGQIAALLRSAVQQQRAARAHVDEAAQLVHQSQTLARVAGEEADRTGKLDHDGLVAPEAAAKAAAEREQRQAAAAASLSAMERIRADRSLEVDGTHLEVARLRLRLVELGAQIKLQRAAIETLKSQIERRRIRAPVAGRVAESANFHKGAVLAAGTRIGTILPEGQVKVTAEFAPAAAAGRIEPGRRGRLRLDGFPWTQFGTIPVTVVSVAAEPRAGRIQVELAVLPGHDRRIPLQHGLPGTVEIDIERLSPAAIVLRAAGRFLGSSTGGGPAAGTGGGS